MILCNDRTEEEYPHIKANNVTSRHTPRTTYYTCYCSATTVVVCCLVVHCIVMWLTGMQCLHDNTNCECRILLAIFPIVAYRTCYMSLYEQKRQVAGEASSTPGTVISHCLVSLKDFRCEGIHRYSTRQHLRIWQLRTSDWDLLEFKKLQASICAGLEEEIRIRNYGSARGSAGKNLAEHTAPLKSKKLPKFPPRPYQPPSHAASAPNLSSQVTFFYFFFYFRQTKYLPLCNKHAKQNIATTLCSFFFFRCG